MPESSSKRVVTESKQANKRTQTQGQSSERNTNEQNVLRPKCGAQNAINTNNNYKHAYINMI